LKKLAEDFGRATENWYAERSLARTEEATFWLETKSRAVGRFRSNEARCGVDAQNQQENGHQVAIKRTEWFQQKPSCGGLATCLE